MKTTSCRDRNHSNVPVTVSGVAKGENKYGRRSPAWHTAKPKTLLRYLLGAVSVTMLLLYVTSRPNPESLPKRKNNVDLTDTELYGSGFTANREAHETDSPAPHQLMVLGFHNTGTSMVTRLLMLMGAWAGEGNDLYVGDRNRLKWWERYDGMVANSHVLLANTKRKMPSWLGLGWQPDALNEKSVKRFNAEAMPIVNELERFTPWVLKDPRMCYTAPLWLDLVDHGVCVVVYRHPVKMAAKLAHHHWKSQGLDARGFMERWHDAMLNVLQACKSTPTVLVPSRLATDEDHIWDVLTTLSEQLTMVGVPNLAPPTAAEVEAEFLSKIHKDELVNLPWYEKGKHRVTDGAAKATTAGEAKAEEEPPCVCDLIKGKGDLDGLIGFDIPEPTPAERCLMDTFHGYLDKTMLEHELLDHGVLAVDMLAAYQQCVDDTQLVQP